MSRGPGKMQTLILKSLRLSREPMSTAELRDDYAHESSEYQTWLDQDDYERFKLSPGRRRSIRISMGRALRQLEATGEIKPNGQGKWYPAKDWTVRDENERQRSSTAYHEAGHAVIGLALKLPIAFVTIKRRASTLGHVSETPMHRSCRGGICEGFISQAYCRHV